MAQAIMDPEEVRRFAKELARFTNDLQNQTSGLQARFSALGDSWQDQEHQKFADEFVTTMKSVNRFTDVASRYAPYLMRKAQKIEEYLNQR